MDQVQQDVAQDARRKGPGDLQGRPGLQPPGGVGLPLGRSQGGGGAGGCQPKPFQGVGGEWRCPRLWPGSTVVCVGGGPSLTRDDLDHVRARTAAGGGTGDGAGRDVRVVCVNDAIKLAPWADAVYAADTSWWRQVGTHVVTDALRVSCQDTEFRQVHVLRYRPGVVLETDPRYVAIGKQRGDDGVAHGGNSGYQAVNLAYHLGAARIVLLGYDMGVGEDGALHWFGRHPVGLNNPTERALARWALAFNGLAPALAAEGVEVVNCSRRTALTCFPRAELEEVLA